MTTWQTTTATLLKPLITAPRLGVVSDVDGTLSPIAPTPGAATIPPLIHDVLRALNQQIALVAIISGRAVADVRDLVQLPELVYVGNHGLERLINGQIVIAPEAATYRPALDAAVREIEPHGVPGMLIEDKGVTVSIHYRQTRDPIQVEAALQPVLLEIVAQHGLKLFRGRMIFEIRPPVAIDKGTAFAQLVTDYHLDTAVYLGDDTTDADALLSARRLRESGVCYALGLGVASDHTPAAVRETSDLLMTGVQDVAAFLSWLLSARSASST